jgi:DNA-binding MarR family transcriptional regulator
MPAPLLVYRAEYDGLRRFLTHAELAAAASGASAEIIKVNVLIEKQGRWAQGRPNSNKRSTLLRIHCNYTENSEKFTEQFEAILIAPALSSPRKSEGIIKKALLGELQGRCSMRNQVQSAILDSPSNSKQEVKHRYVEALTLIERLHRRLLDVIKDEFERQGDPEVNAVQALLLFNIGDAELTAGELKTRGHYQGSNVSYNLKKLVEAGYVNHERSTSDKRSVRVRLTPRGQDIRKKIDALYNRQILSITDVAGLSIEEFDRLNKALARLERFWTDQILYRL